MSKNKDIRSVAFNITKERDIQMLKYIDNKKNFSGYVRELIYADMLRQEAASKIVHKSNGGGIKIVVGR